MTDHATVPDESRPDRAAGRVTIVHDYLTQRGGAERVVLEMAAAFPGAPVVTALYDRDGTYPAFRDLDVGTLAVDRLPGLRRHHRLALPVLAPAFSAGCVRTPVALCSSSGWAHGIRAEGTKVVYCHNPPRWLYQADEYLRDRHPAYRVMLAALGPGLRRWDHRAARSAARYLVNSELVRRRVADTYGIEAEVLHPPVSLLPDGPVTPIQGVDDGFHLCVSRLLPYKNVDAVVAAFADLADERLVVIGGGPLLERLRASAPANVRLCGEVDDATLRWAYGACRALIAASYEDFGLTPVEAAGFAKPTLALRWGGYLETVVEDRTGQFFDAPDPAHIARAVERARSWDWSPTAITAHSETFSRESFRRRLQEVVGDAP